MYMTAKTALKPVFAAMALAMGGLVATAGLSVQVQADMDADLMAGLKARSIGPATMSGRIASVDALVDDPDTIFVGAATGGAWKSMDGGVTFQPIFDDQPVASVGAIRVNQQNPDIVWIGTGEGNPRNSTSIGGGVFKSLDGGKSWARMGLETSERIHRIVLHPTDPDTVWVGAMGRLWSAGGERGVYKTTDGGRTWRQVLGGNDRTGVADLVIDPSNPNKLVAALWEFQRRPYTFKSGGEGSGLFLSVDGGDTWKRLTAADGLPEGDLGRIGVGFAASEPNILYAVVEAEKSALIKSVDGGHSWTTINKSHDVNPRPFYYADIRVDPGNPLRIYQLSSLARISEDGGKSFRNWITYADLHPDHHALWINPNNPKHMINGNDGGIGISWNAGKTWRYAFNLPLAQFYHVWVDDAQPYNVYGGLQDNGSWQGPSEVWENGGIRNHHWQEVAFGDGFDTRPLPGDTTRGYAMSQEGFVVRWDMNTGGRTVIRPAAPDADTELRFNWNAAIAQDPFDDKTIYFGSQFVHKSTNMGDDWTIISADLTTNNPDHQKYDEVGGITPDVTGAENFNSIVAIVPSPLQKDLLWVGTDDGRVHLTRDGGATWEDIGRRRARGVPEGSWVPHIEPSPHDPSVAFVVFDNHRRGDMSPYAFRVENYGRRWVRIADGDAVSGYALSIKQDPVDANLLFLGTEFGLWVSTNAGGDWFKWTAGIPTASVMDLAIQERETDLVVATHGRAAYVIDDYAALRGLTETAFEDRLSLLDTTPGIQYIVKQTGGERFPGAGEFRGENPARGAWITVMASGDDLPHPDDEAERARKNMRAANTRGGDNGGAKEPPKAKLVITDADGAVIQERDVTLQQGINRLAWNMNHDRLLKLADAKGEAPWGPPVLPGDYGFTLTLGDDSVEGTLTVQADPRIRTDMAALETRLTAQKQTVALRESLVKAVNRILQAYGDLKVLSDLAGDAAGRAEDDEAKKPYTDFAKKIGEVRDSLKTLEKKLRTPPKTVGIIRDTSVETAVGLAGWFTGMAQGAPNAANMAYVEHARVKLSRILPEVNAAFTDTVLSLRQEAADLGLGLLSDTGAVEMPQN